MTEDTLMAEIRERMDASAQKCLAEYSERMARRYSLELFHDGEKIVFDACQTAQYEWVGQHTMHYILSEDWGRPEYFGPPAAASRRASAIAEQGRDMTKKERAEYDRMCCEVREIYDSTPTSSATSGTWSWARAARAYVGISETDEGEDLA